MPKFRFTAYFMNGSQKGQTLELSKPTAWLDLPIPSKPFSNKEKIYERYYFFFTFNDAYFYSISNDNTHFIYDGLLLLMEKKMIE